MQKRDGVNARGDRGVMLPVWSQVPSSCPSHWLKMQEVSPEAVTEQGEVGKRTPCSDANSTSQLVGCRALLRDGDYKLRMEAIRAGALGHCVLCAGEVGGRLTDTEARASL